MFGNVKNMFPWLGSINGSQVEWRNKQRKKLHANDLIENSSCAFNGDEVKNKIFNIDTTYSNYKYLNTFWIHSVLWFNNFDLDNRKRWVEWRGKKYLQHAVNEVFFNSSNRSMTHHKFMLNAEKTREQTKEIEAMR